MSALPWILGAGAVGVGAYLWREQRQDERTEPQNAANMLLALVENQPKRVPGIRPGIMTAPPPPSMITPSPAASQAPTFPGRWVWPVAAFRGRAPVISSGFGMRGGVPHKGVDVMFRRTPSDALAAGTPNGSKLFVMPDNLPALAAHDGVVWSALQTPRGFAVIIDHKPLPIATFYTHLDRLFVKPTARGATNEKVRAGQPIGNIGFSPTDPEKLKHLHFEIWPGGPTSPGAAIDPAPMMARWEVVGVVDRSLVAGTAAGAQAKPIQLATTKVAV